MDDVTRRAMLTATAAKYQTAIKPSKSTVTGAPLADHHGGRTRDVRELRTNSFVIGMPGSKPLANAVCDRDEFGRLAKLERAVPREVAGDEVDNSAGSW